MTAIAFPSDYFPGEVYPGEETAGPVVLDESEWMLDGVRFGVPKWSGLAIAKCDWGDWSLDLSDSNNPAGHGTVPGRDYVRAATIAFDVFTSHTSSHVDAFATLAALTSRWEQGAEMRPGETVPLRTCLGGRQVVVYGRPRRFSQPVADVLSKVGKATAALDFQVTDPLIYEAHPEGLDALAHELPLGLLMPNTEGGVLWDDPRGGADTDFWWDGGGEQTRAGVFVCGSTVPTPFRLEIHGPVRNPVVVGEGWRVAFTGRGGLTIPYDRSVVVDTRTRTARWDTGTSVAGYLSRDSRLTSLLSPGQQELTIAGEDPTGTSTFTLSWSDATRSTASVAVLGQAGAL